MKNKLLVLFGFFFLLCSLALTTNSCSNNDDNNDEDDPLTGAVVDVDGNSYDTVRIGTQTWMVQNLKTTKYNDGTEIPAAAINADWPNVITPCYCWYDNDETFKETYGALYNFYAVNTGKLAPTGWHIPSPAEFELCRNYLGSMGMGEGKMMESGTAHWTNNSASVTNSSGFTAMPGGLRWSTFSGMGSMACWWTSTLNGSSSGWYKMLTNYMMSSNSATKSYGMSVRCVKDNN